MITKTLAGLAWHTHTSLETNYNGVGPETKDPGSSPSVAEDLTPTERRGISAASKCFVKNFCTCLTEAVSDFIQQSRDLLFMVKAMLCRWSRHSIASAQCDRERKLCDGAAMTSSLLNGCNNFTKHGNHHDSSDVWGSFEMYRIRMQSGNTFRVCLQEM